MFRDEAGSTGVRLPLPECRHEGRLQPGYEHCRRQERADPGIGDRAVRRLPRQRDAQPDDPSFSDRHLIVGLLADQHRVGGQFPRFVQEPRAALAARLFIRDKGEQHAVGRIESTPREGEERRHLRRHTPLVVTGAPAVDRPCAQGGVVGVALPGRGSPAGCVS